jgi:hypothetical protein
LRNKCCFISERQGFKWLVCRYSFDSLKRTLGSEDRATSHALSCPKAVNASIGGETDQLDLGAYIKELRVNGRNLLQPKRTILSGTSLFRGESQALEPSVSRGLRLSERKWSLGTTRFNFLLFPSLLILHPCYGWSLIGREVSGKALRS